MRGFPKNQGFDSIGLRTLSIKPGIIAGLPTSFDDAREEVVYELAAALVASWIVPLGLYRRARELIGNTGIVDVAVLIGWFTMVSMTLNAFDVPANAVGLDQ